MLIDIKLSEICQQLNNNELIFEHQICMKQFNRLVMILVLFTACNGKDSPVVSGDSTNPEKLMKDAITAFPDSLLLKENLVQYYRDNGEYDMSLATTNDAIKKDSLNPRLWNMKATLYFENEDTVNSIKAFEKGIGLSPDPQYIISLATIYAETKNAKALAMADALLLAKKTKSDKEAFFIKGLYYNYSGDKAKAIDLFDKCLAMDYTYMFAYREKAIALYDLGRYEAALSVADKAVTLQNNFDEGHYWRGRCLEKLNRPGDAIEAYHTALLYSPDYIEAQDALARLGVK